MAKKKRTQAIVGVSLAFATAAYFVYTSRKQAAMGRRMSVDPDIAADMISMAGNLNPSGTALVRLGAWGLASKIGGPMGFEVRKLKSGGI